MKIINTKKKRLSDWFGLVEKTVEFENKKAVYHSIDVHDYVSIIAINKKNEILLVEQYRPAVEKKTIELPGGIFKYPEDPKQIVIKELLEETGYRINGEIKKLNCLDVDFGRLFNKAYCYFCNDISFDDKANVEKGITTITHPQGNIESLIRSNKLTHAPHIAFILLAKLNGLF